MLDSNIMPLKVVQVSRRSCRFVSQSVKQLLSKIEVCKGLKYCLEITQKYSVNGCRNFYFLTLSLKYIPSILSDILSDVEQQS